MSSTDDYSYTYSGSYGYSYSYSDDEQSVTRRPAPVEKEDGETKKDTEASGDSYSSDDDYSYDTEESGSGSYSYYYEETSESGKPQKELGEKDTDETSGYYYYSTDGTTRSYTYDSSGDATASGEDGQKEEEEDYSYSYSYSGSYDAGSGSGTTGKSSGSYYSYSSSEKGQPSGSYSYSPSTSNPTEGSSSSYSYSYSYSDSGSATYTTESPSYESYSGSSTTYSPLQSYSYDYTSSTSKSVLVDDKSDRSTTSSYQYSSEAPSVSTPSEDIVIRDVLILRTPAMEVPHAPPVPKRCFVYARLEEDAVFTFLQQLMQVQQSADAVAAGAPEPVVPLSAQEDSDHPRPHFTSKETIVMKKKVSHGDVPTQSLLTAVTPDGFFSSRSASFALRMLGLSHPERAEALKGTAVPIKEDTFTAILNACVTARVREKVVQAFFAHDKYRSGEIPLSQTADVLRRFGIAKSPVIDGFRVNIGCSSRAKRPEMVMTLAVQDVETEEWCEEAIAVCGIIRESMKEKRPTTLRWNEEAVYMGQYCILRHVSREATFQRLKTYIEAATYACILVQLYAVSNPSAAPSVQYPHLLRSLLVLASPTTERMEAGAAKKERKSIYLENLFHNIYHPADCLAHYAAGKGIPLPFAGKEPINSTLGATRDSVDKRRRNAVLFTTPDQTRLVASPPRATGDVQLCFALQKVRIPNAVPEGVRCFCLVSAVTSDDVFLPAVEIPVRSVRVSSKSGFTWVFVDKKHGRDHASMLFVGPSSDRLYIECCYESADGANGEPPTTWCAGYAMSPIAGMKTGTLPVQEGSLLNAPASSPASLTEAPPLPMKKRGLFACLSCKRAKATTAASDVKVEVLDTHSKTIPKAEDMPSRYLILRRHIDIVTLLRAAIMHMGGKCSHAPQAMRQQAVRRAFVVAADSLLLDQLARLWKYKKKHELGKLTKSKKEIEGNQRSPSLHDVLLECASTLAAMNNTTTVSRKNFADLVIKAKALAADADDAAPQVPCTV